MVFLFCFFFVFEEFGGRMKKVVNGSELRRIRFVFFLEIGDGRVMIWFVCWSWFVLEIWGRWEWWLDVCMCKLLMVVIERERERDVIKLNLREFYIWYFFIVLNDIYIFNYL